MTKVRCPKCGNTKKIHLIVLPEKLEYANVIDRYTAEWGTTQTLAVKCPECGYIDSRAIYPDARDFEPWLDDNKRVRPGREAHDYHGI